MEQKKDIGKFFENKLANGEKKPSISLWEKVNTTLEAEKRRRRRVAYYWLATGIGIALLGIIILSKMNIFSTEEIQNNNGVLIEETNTNSSVEKADTESKKSVSEISTIDSLNLEITSEETLSKIVSIKETQNSNETKNASNKNVQNKKNSSFKENGYVVSEKYYYYNSRDGKQIVTSDKKVIDSLLSEGTKIIDSSTVKKTNIPHD